MGSPRPPTSAPDLIREVRGAVFLEFLIAFVPLWTFALCIFQLALIGRANLIVKHSADAAARSAAVVLPDDPAEYGGQPQMHVGRNRIGAGDLSSALTRIAGGVFGSDSVRSVASAISGRALANVGTSRLNTIRLAAHVPLMPLSPVDVGADARPTLRKSLGGPRSLSSAGYYQPFAVAVTFPDVSGSIAAGPEIRVRVTYAYQCSVPLARRILCAPFEDLESEQAWGQSFLPVAQRFVGGWFREIEHESTTLIHSAPYEYRPRRS